MNIENFAAFLRKSNKSGNTIASYLYALQQFAALHAKVNKHTLGLYKAYLLERFKPKTVNIRLLALNCYVGSIGKSELKMPLVRIQQKPFLENVISDADYAYFKRRLNNPTERYWYFVIRFLAATGARISELLQLKVEHVAVGHIDLYSKGGKMRRIYIPLTARNYRATRGRTMAARAQTRLWLYLYKQEWCANHRARHSGAAEETRDQIQTKPCRGLSTLVPSSVRQELFGEVQRYIASCRPYGA